MRIRTREVHNQMYNTIVFILKSIHAVYMLLIITFFKSVIYKGKHAYSHHLKFRAKNKNRLEIFMILFSNQIIFMLKF